MTICIYSSLKGDDCQSTIILRIDKVASVFEFSEFFRAFCKFDFRTYPVKKSKQMLLPIRPLFWRLPEKENRLRDVVKKFR